MSNVGEIEVPTGSMFVGKNATVYTRENPRRGDTAVVEKQRLGTEVAPWGDNNDTPQELAQYCDRVSILPAVINKKVDLLVGGGVRYGHVLVDEATGFERLVPKDIPEVNDFLEGTNIDLYCEESGHEWYTYSNLFVEFVMNKSKSRVNRISCLDACHTRLGRMDDRGEISKAYIADWGGGATVSDAYVRTVIDPYTNTLDQLLSGKDGRYVLPERILTRGRLYYARGPLETLRYSGWLDVLARVPELKKLLLDQLHHLRYHIEIDQRYWPLMIDGYAGMTVKDKVAAMKTHVQEIENWLKGEGQGGSWMSMMLSHQGSTDQTSLVKIHEKRLTTMNGAYIEDSQEGDFITCRDMGLKPSLLGISASKSGSSPGSGSEDRVARTNHVLDCKRDQNRLLRALNLVKKANGWDPKLKFWFSNYYAATLDRTNQVDSKPHPGAER